MDSIPLKKKFFGRRNKVPSWVKEQTQELLRQSHLERGVKEVVEAIAHDKRSPLDLKLMFNAKLNRVQS